VLAEIDIRKAMKEKLNAEYPSYTILGACNPQLEHRSLQAEPRLGLLLPCKGAAEEEFGGAPTFEDPVVEQDYLNNMAISGGLCGMTGSSPCD